MGDGVLETPQERHGDEEEHGVGRERSHPTAAAFLRGEALGLDVTQTPVGAQAKEDGDERDPAGNRDRGNMEQDRSHLRGLRPGGVGRYQQAVSKESGPESDGDVGDVERGPETGIDEIDDVAIANAIYQVADSAPELQ